MNKKSREKVRCYLKAIWLWVNIWHMDWWNATEEKANEGYYYVDCKTAWEIAKGIWLK